LERKVGRQAMEINFFVRSLAACRGLGRPSIVSGTSVSLAKYGPQGGKAGGKANEAK